jgi:hypothetical protein
VAVVGAGNAREGCELLQLIDNVQEGLLGLVGSNQLL